MMSRLRLLVVAWAGPSIGGVGAACALASGCLTTAPPAVSTPPLPRPTILQDSVVPPPDQLLVELPSEFAVPVQLQDPSETFRYDVFVDYPTNPSPVIFPVTVTPSGAEDAGIVPVSFTPDEMNPPPDPTTCHTIQFLVVQDFAQVEAGPILYHVPNLVGGDSVTWFYAPGGGIDGCPVYDAGIFEDGATPPDGEADAPSAADDSP
ncbi:MAG TPA: hypothetical protein VEK07_09760 [Polyangiaceae bacterium]|nr:hypothetical protein [Polyangiaceae bacterium]